MTAASDDGLAARRGALTLIEGAMARRGGLDETMGGALAGLEGRDRAFARNLAMTTLRHWGQIERVLASRLASPPPAPVMALMRIGLRAQSN